MEYYLPEPNIFPSGGKGICGPSQHNLKIKQLTKQTLRRAMIWDQYCNPAVCFSHYIVFVFSFLYILVNQSPMQCQIPITK